MAYLGTAPGIDSQLITDSVSAGFERALEALVPDPVRGEMVFDEEKIDQLLAEKSQYLKDEPLILPLPTSQGLTVIDITDPGERQEFWADPVQGEGCNGAEFVSTTGNGGGGMFPLMAVGLLAYLSSR